MNIPHFCDVHKKTNATLIPIYADTDFQKTNLSFVTPNLLSSKNEAMTTTEIHSAILLKCTSLENCVVFEKLVFKTLNFLTKKGIVQDYDMCHKNWLLGENFNGFCKIY